MDKRLLRVLPIERWPTEDEAARMRWFSPIRIGRLALEARTWVPAMVPWRATEEGHVTPEVLQWYRRFAQGKPGAIVVEATGVRDVKSGPLLRIGHDRFLPGLEELVRTVREASGDRTRLFIQIIDFLVVRRRPERDKFLRRFLAVDPRTRERAAERFADRSLLESDEAAFRERLVAADDGELAAILDPRELENLERGYRERVTDLHLPHVRDLPSQLPEVFASAAERARRAGFDGVELHYAHAYTMASFLSARNTRDDGFGGSRENRLRLPLEVYRAVRSRAGADYAIGVRLLGDEAIAGGSTLDDACWFGVELAKAGLDYLSVSKGGKFEDARAPKVGDAIYPYTGPSGHECMPTVRIEGGAFGRNVPLAAAIRRAVRHAGLSTPIVTAGGIASPWQAEAILERGDADIVAAARQSLADPDWFLKIRTGRGADVRRCFFTNYCEALDQAHKEVTCQRWDREFPLGHEGVALAKDGRRRLVAP
jgi:2,4-dienoyl-CoA reductase-like NADH-dependent reductase (Old Yellow Enzyme family)